MKIYIDIDETICQTPPSRNYADAKPIQKNIDLANELYDEGHTITFWTARGSVSGKDWQEITEKQLDDWGCNRHHLLMGKPAYDVFIDDKAINASVWENKGNDVIRKIAVQNLDCASAVDKQLEISKPKNPTEATAWTNRKYRWVFQGEFPNNVNFPPCFARIDHRPSFEIEEIIFDESRNIKVQGKRLWSPITISVFDVDAKGEFIETLANVCACIFDDKSCELGNCRGSCRLTLYDGLGTPTEAWDLEEAYFVSVAFSEPDHSNTNPLGIELTMMYNNAKCIDVLDLGFDLGTTSTQSSHDM